MMREIPMADRDAWWSTKIHNDWGSEGPIDRLVDWAREVSPTIDVDEQVVDLSAITLSWFLTSSNRFLRDAATKALISLLDGRFTSVRKLVQRFADVDDPYVLERLYAVAYGVSMRSRNVEDVCSLAQSVFERVFSSEAPPVHILLRKCLKSVLGSGSNVDMGAPKLVFHEQREISKRPERQRMATLGTVAACSQTSRPADQIPAQGGGERYSLCVAHRMRMANASSRPASVAHHVPLLPHLAWRWDHGADT